MTCQIIRLVWMTLSGGRTATGQFCVLQCARSRRHKRYDGFHICYQRRLSSEIQVIRSSHLSAHKVMTVHIQYHRYGKHTTHGYIESCIHAITSPCIFLELLVLYSISVPITPEDMVLWLLSVPASAQSGILL